MPDRPAISNRVCWHCRREGEFGYIKIIDGEGNGHWVCEDGNACLRRFQAGHATRNRVVELSRSDWNVLMTGLGLIKSQAADEVRAKLVKAFRD